MYELKLNVEKRKKISIIHGFVCIRYSKIALKKCVLNPLYILSQFIISCLDFSPIFFTESEKFGGDLHNLFISKSKQNIFLFFRQTLDKNEDSVM